VHGPTAPSVLSRKVQRTHTRKARKAHRRHTGGTEGTQKTHLASCDACTIHCLVYRVVFPYNQHTFDYLFKFQCPSLPTSLMTPLNCQTHPNHLNLTNHLNHLIVESGDSLINNRDQNIVSFTSHMVHHHRTDLLGRQSISARVDFMKYSLPVHCRLCTLTEM
jgi:hypothetical protein